VFEKLEAPAPLKARTRYLYDVAGRTVVSAKAVTFGPTVAI
jgi:hypothetical protein